MQAEHQRSGLTLVLQQRVLTSKRWEPCRRPQQRRQEHRCGELHRRTCCSSPQTPRLCLSLNIYFQRINARGRQDLAPRQKGDTRNSNTGVQTHISAALTDFRRLQTDVLGVWPSLLWPLQARPSVAFRSGAVRNGFQEVSLSFLPSLR